MINYEGFFIKNELKSKLFKDIEFKHVTTEYRPAVDHPELYGAVARFKIIGYGNNGQNEGVKVSLMSIDVSDLPDNRGKAAQLYDLFNAIEVPHITLSIAEGAKAVNTKDLDFSEKYNVDTVTGIFGGFNGNRPILESI